MVDYERTVDEIRTFLQGGDHTFRDGLRNLATAYGGACREANERLRRCEEFLNKGLRSEAIHLAQVEPVLLDVLVVLDFPERGRWEELSALYDLPPAPALRLAAAATLNGAYAEEQPLEALLRQHRRLALMRAPLVDRLGALRQLTKAEPTNLAWGDQVGELERARHGQAQAAADEALARDDLHGLFAVWDEIEKAPWQERPPESMVRSLGREVAQRSHLRMRMELEGLTRELVDAHSRSDEAKARRLRDAWWRVCKEARLPPEDPLCKRVAQALRWLATQDRRQSEAFAFQADLEQLEQALRRNAGAAKLESLYEAVLKHKLEVPPPLERRYEARREELAARAQWRERIILTATVSVAILGMIGLILVLAAQ